MTADPTHRHDQFHRGQVPTGQLADGTATSGYVPTSNGDGTVTWAAGGSGGGETLAATLILGNDAGGTDITDSGDLGLTATDNINLTAGAGGNVNINAPESINITADTDTDDSGAVVIEAGASARVTVSAATEAVAIRTHGSAGGTGEFLASDGSGGTTWATPSTSGGFFPILISDTPSNPLVFDDLLQNDAGDDLLYAD